MSRFLLMMLGAVTLALGLVAVVPAQVIPPARAQTPPAQQVPMDDTQTLVYLGETRPVLVRMHVLIDGKPYSAAWDGFMKKLFEYLDVNGDGSLSREEAARVPSVQLLRNHYVGIIGIFEGGGNVPQFLELDANKDGKVTPDELKAYYRKSGLGAFQVRGGPGQGKSGALTDALFKYLDRNHDGKLSRDELAAADETLHRLDLDEDEMITEEELVPSSNAYSRVFFGPDGNQNEPANSSFQVLAPGEATARVSKAIFDRYDKDKNGKLSRAESGFDEATFARVDANKDGQIDGGELQKWLAGPSDLELTVRLGGMPQRRQPGGLLKAVVDAGRNPATAGVEVTPGKDWPMAASVRTQGDGVIFTQGIAQIDVHGGDNLGRFGGARQFYIQQFKQALKDKKDYLEKKDVQQTDFLRGLFTFADRDNDGKLTEKELTAFFEAIEDGMNASVSLTVADHGSGLFELIDANRDGRLSIRELRTAWERIAPWDKANTGSISREQIPRQYSLTVRQGTVDDRRFRAAVRVRGPRGQPVASSGRGPLWFRKMDRNGDGDVSPREWLGSMEDFKKIDTNGDGLISADEAEKADAWFREKMKEKK
jgi:Ca2+-binding EF-hand superfamily protein